MTEHDSQYIGISTSTVLKIILVALGLFFLYLIRDIVLMVFVAVVVAAAVGGPVSWLQKRKVPRVLGVAFIYLIILLLLSLTFSLILPPLAEQAQNLANYFPTLMSRIGFNVHEWWGQYKIETNLQNFLAQAGNQLSQTTSGIFATIIDLFGGVFSTIVVLVISFYLSTQEKGVKEFILSLTPESHQPYISSLIDRIQIKIGGWLRGQLLIMLIIGLLTYFGLTALGVKYALLLALIAGFLEIIPYLGPIIAAIPAVILTFAQSPFLAVAVLILYVVIQQLENYVITPQMMKRTVGLNPAVIIIVMLIGAKLAGVLGIILSVPVAAIAKELFGDFRK